MGIVSTLLPCWATADYNKVVPGKVTVRASNSTLVPWQTQRTNDRKCKLTKLVIRIASGFRLKRIGRIDHVLLMIDSEYPSPVYLHFN
jgi:hypothetical protein